MTPKLYTSFFDRLTGSICGLAIGDGMGGPVEGWSPQRIRERFHDWDFTTFLPTTDWAPKGHGRITDDTLMTEALIRAYGVAGAHLDATDYRDFLLPEMCDRKVWVPERQQEMAIIDRLNNIERYTRYRLRDFGAEPRLAGQGNALNCAIAMFIMPVGAVNAGDPHAAYQEAAALGMAESHSYAVEGAAALAAAYAEALADGATVDSVIHAARDLGRDGVRAAIIAAQEATDPTDSTDRWIERVRGAMVSFDVHSDTLPLEQVAASAQQQVRNLPDPRGCFEEMPVALAALRYGQGDFLRTLRTAVSYGRDADSIAGMACGLCGGLVGQSGIPEKLITASHQANRRDWPAMAKNFTQVICTIWTADRIRQHRRQKMLEPLLAKT